MNQPPRLAARAFSLLLTISLLSGCATNPATPGRTTSPDVARLLVDIPVDPATSRSVPIFTPDGQSVPWAELVAQAADADVVLIGEIHGHPRGLPAAAALFEDLVAKRSAAGTTPVLAMEFFERDQQAALDDFLAGLTDEPAMLRATSKSSPESYPPGHRAMILLAKRQGLPVIAANAPRRYVRFARTEGYDRLRRLTPEQRRLFDLPTSEPSPAYREAFDRVMNANAGVDEGALANDTARAERRASLDATFRSQWLWDSTMGTSVARALDLGRPVVLVVGVFHVEHTGGTAQVIRTLRPDARVLTVVFADQDPPATPAARAAASANGDELRIYVGPAAQDSRN